MKNINNSDKEAKNILDALMYLSQEAKSLGLEEIFKILNTAWIAGNGWLIERAFIQDEITELIFLQKFHNASQSTRDKTLKIITGLNNLKTTAQVENIFLFKPRKK